MSDSKKTIDPNVDTLWPKKGDSLITQVGGNFLAQTLPSKEWEVYVVAYRMAAEILVERIAEPTILTNLMVFPIVFLYRHYLELRLKTLIQDGNALYGEPAKFTEKEHHLLTLWGKCRPMVEKRFPHYPKSDLDAVENTLKQFEQLDPLSMAGRYPTDNKAGNPSSLLGIKINLKTFADTVTKTGNFLDSVADEFAERKTNDF
ncbi:MAG: hypothetical protein ABSF10_04525 [Verrucomicrobiota bacterium]|jgi:hypothetical protein